MDLPLAEPALRGQGAEMDKPASGLYKTKKELSDLHSQENSIFISSFVFIR